MKRYYFAWFGPRSVRVTPMGIASSKILGIKGSRASQFALVYGANARQARHYFIEGNVSKWFRD